MFAGGTPRGVVFVQVRGVLVFQVWLGCWLLGCGVCVKWCVLPDVCWCMSPHMRVVAASVCVAKMVICVLDTHAWVPCMWAYWVGVYVFIRGVLCHLVSGV